jgi:hypothetical protein
MGIHFGGSFSGEFVLTSIHSALALSFKSIAGTCGAANRSLSARMGFPAAPALFTE